MQDRGTEDQDEDDCAKVSVINSVAIKVVFFFFRKDILTEFKTKQFFMFVFSWSEFSLFYQLILSSFRSSYSILSSFQLATTVKY